MQPPHLYSPVTDVHQHIFRQEQNGHEDDVNDLCVNPRCRDFGQHLAEHWHDNCRGCQPRPAVIGNLCASCCANLGRDAIAATQLYLELEGDLVITGAGTGSGGVNPFPGISFNDGAAATRDEINSILSSWCKLIVEEGGFPPPGPANWRLQRLPHGAQGPRNRMPYREPGIGYLGDFIRRHRLWLATHLAAGDACDEIAGLVAEASFRQEKTRAAKVELGSCPECGYGLTAIIGRADAGAGAAIVCAGEEKHRWAAHEWAALFKQMRRAIHVIPEVQNV